jgi:hypothetical protein
MSRIRSNTKGGTGKAWSIKEASEFEEQANSFDEVRPVAKDKFAGDHGPMNLQTIRGSAVLLSDLRRGLGLRDLLDARVITFGRPRARFVSGSNFGPVSESIQIC